VVSQNEIDKAVEAFLVEEEHLNHNKRDIEPFRAILIDSIAWTKAKEHLTITVPQGPRSQKTLKAVYLLKGKSFPFWSAYPRQ
jgi:hypothetical protein